MSIEMGSTVRFVDKDGAGDDDVRHGDVGVVVYSDSEFGEGDNIIGVKLKDRDITVSTFEYRWMLVAVEPEITLDEAVKQCKNLKTEIQRLQLELNKYEGVLFKAGVKLI